MYGRLNKGDLDSFTNFRRQGVPRGVLIGVTATVLFRPVSVHLMLKTKDSFSPLSKPRLDIRVSFSVQTELLNQGRSGLQHPESGD